MRSGGGVRLGKIFGIPILLDYSFFLALAFVTYQIGRHTSELQSGPALRWRNSSAGAPSAVRSGRRG